MATVASMRSSLTEDTSISRTPFVTVFAYFVTPRKILSPIRTPLIRALLFQEEVPLYVCIEICTFDLYLFFLQALTQVSQFLGYPTTRSFLEDHLVSMVGDWLDKGQQLAEFPCQLFGERNQQQFFQ